jgi:dihydroorotase
LQLCELTGARFHVAHLSARKSLELVREAKGRGSPVTCEVTPHHFTLTDEDVRYDTRYKMNPPLAALDDRSALVEGLRDGTVDAIATDHAPHASHLKDVEFDQAPFGVTGFETALPLALDELHRRAGIALLRIVELFTTGPARVLGPSLAAQRSIAPGNPADLTIFSLDHEWTFRAAESLSLSRNSPFDGRVFKGCAAATVVAGHLVWKT